MLVCYLYHSSQNSVIIYMVMLPGHFFRKTCRLQSSHKKIHQEDKQWNQGKIKGGGIQQFLFLCCFIICCFLNSCFCENRKTFRPLDKMPQLLPSCPLFTERIFFSFLSTRTLEYSRDLERKEEIIIIIFSIYFGSGALLSNLAEIILFNSHRDFDRQVWAHLINEKTTAYKDIQYGAEIQTHVYSASFPFTVQDRYLPLANFSQGLPCFNCCPRSSKLHDHEYAVFFPWNGHCLYF